MRILITGGAGFIGSHLSEFCLEKGHEVTVIDNCITGSEKNIGHLLSNQKFLFIKQNILTFDFSSLAGQVDIIFHLASPASPIQYKKYPIETLEVNSLGTERVLEYATEKNALVIFASTSEVYGDPLVHPQPESYWGNVNPIGVRACYDEAKRFGEAMCISYVSAKKTNVRIARIFNTYGPRMDIQDGRVVSNFIVQALRNEPITVYGTGSQTRSCSYVSDLVEGLFLLATKHVDSGEVVNLGNETEFTVLEIAKQIKELTQSTSEIIYTPIDKDDPKRRKPDLTKAKQILHWEAKIPFAEGLEKTITYFKSVL